MRHPPTPSRRGFTLIELLVVVAIIALLIAILIPSLAYARALAQRSACASRVKGHTTALSTYFADWDNACPINGVLFPKSGVPTVYQNPPGNMYAAAEVTTQSQWILQNGGLWTYMNQQPKAYLCPIDTGQRTNPTTAAPNAALTLDGAGNVRTGPNNGGYWSYSVNTVLNSLGRWRNNPEIGTSWGDPLKATSIKSPANFVTFIEEANDSLFNDEVFEPPQYTATNKFTDRHSGKTGLIGYGDGHAEPMKTADFMASYPDPYNNPITRMFLPNLP